jgi:hypothetical protein
MISFPAPDALSSRGAGGMIQLKGSVPKSR